jgi:hypothetical protein
MRKTFAVSGSSREPAASSQLNSAQSLRSGDVLLPISSVPFRQQLFSSACKIRQRLEAIGTGRTV